MDTSRDTRIVEMQFENRDFERNISESKRSLERFKKELNFDEATKGIEKFSNAVSDTTVFNKMSDSIAKLSERFTGIGSVGDYVARKIRSAWEGAADSVGRFIQSMTTAQTSAGFGKYETLNKSVQTLKSATQKDEKEIYRILDKLNTYTDQTSYDFAQGVTSISQLVSSGAATLEQAEITVEGFYNYAAKAGADVQKASQALNYSMVQAFQRGYLDWSNAKELSNRSMLTADFKNTLLETAVAYGKVTKKANKYYVTVHKAKKDELVEINATNLFNDSLQYQWATSEVLNATLAKYADTTKAFGREAYAAAQRCTTFGDALNAWKDMLSTGWMQTYRTIFGDLSEAMQLFSGICDKVSDSLGGLSETRNKILKGWAKYGGKESLWSLLVGELETPDSGIKYEGSFGILDIFNDLGTMISNAFWDTIKDSIKVGFNQEDWDKEGFKELYLGGVIAYYTEEVRKFIQQFKDFFHEINPETGITRFEQLQNIVSAVFSTVRFIGSSIGGVSKFIGQVLERFQPSFDAFLNLLSELGLVIKDSENTVVNGNKINEFFKNLLDSVSPILDLINNTTTDVLNFFTSLITSSEEADEASENVKKTKNSWTELKDFFSGLSDILKTIINPLKTGLKQIFGAFSSGFNKVGKKSEEGEKAFNFFESILDILTPIAKTIGEVIRLVTDLIADFITWGNESGTFSKVWEGALSIITTVIEKFTGLWTTFSSLFGKVWASVKKMFSNGFTKENISIMWSEIKTALSSYKTELGNLFPELTAWVKKFYNKIIGLFSYSPENGGKKVGLFEGIYTGIKDSFNNLVGKLNGFLPEIGTTVKGFFGTLFGLFNGDEQDTVEAKRKSFKFDPNMVIAMGGISDVSSLRKPVGELNEASKELSKTGSELKETKNEIVTFGDAIISTLNGLFQQIKEFFGTDNDFEAIVLLLIGYLSIRTVIKLIGKALGAVKDIGYGFKVISGAISNLVNGSTQTETRSDKIFKIASAIGILSAAIVVLGNMELGKAAQGIGAIFLTMIMLGAFIHFMNKEFTKKKDDGVFNAKGLVIAAIGLGFAIAKIVSAMKPIMDIKFEDDAWGRIGRMLISLFVIMALLAGFMILVGKFQGKGASIGSFLSIVAIAFALHSVINAIIRLTDLKLDPARSEALNIAYNMISKLMALMALVGFAGKGGSIKDAGFLLAGIGVLMWAMKDFSTLYGDPNMWGKLALVFGSMIATLGIVFAFAKLMKKFDASLKDTGMSEFLLVVIGIAILIPVLKSVLSLYEGDGNAWEKWGMMMATLATILGLLWGFTALMGKHTMKGSGFGNIIVIAIGIWSILTVLKSVTTMSWESLAKMGATLLVVLGLLVGFVAGIRAVEKKFDSGGMKKSFSLGTMIGLVIGIAALIQVMKPMADMEWSALGKMGASFALIILGLTVAVGVIQKTAGGFKAAVGSVAIIWTLALAIWRIVHALEPLADLDNVRYNKVLIAVVTIIGSLALAATLIQKTSTSFGNAAGSFAIIVGFVGGLVALLIFLQPLFSVNEADLKKVQTFFIFVLGKLALAVRGIQKSATTFGNAMGSFAIIIAFVAATYGLVQTLLPLANLTWDELGKIGVSMLAIIGPLAYAAAYLEANAQPFQNGAGAALLLVGFAAAIWLARIALMPFASMDWENLGKIVTGFVTFVVGMTVSILALMNAANNDQTDFKPLIKELLSLGMIIGAMWLAIKILTPLTELKWSDYIKMIASFGVMMFGLTTSVTSLMGSMNDSEAGIKEIGKMFAVIAGVVLMMVALSLTLKNVANVKWSTILAFSIGLGVMLVTMAAAVNLLGKIDVKSALTGILVMVVGMAAVLGVVAGLGSWVLDSLSESLPGFTESLTLLGKALLSFKKDSKGMKDVDISGALKVLSELAKLQIALTRQNISVSVFKMFTGDASLQAASLTGFGQDVAAVGKFVADFANAIGESDFSNVDSAVNALMAISKVQESLTNENIKLAVFSKLLGLKGEDKIQPGNLKEFGEDVVAIAPMLQTVGESLAGTDFSAFDTAARAIAAIVDVRSKLTNENIKLGIFSKIVGNQINAGSLKEFGEDLVAIAPMLELVGGKLSDTDFTNFGAAAAALKEMQSVSGLLTDESIKLEIFGKLLGLPPGTLKKQNISDFVADLIIIAPSMQTLGDKLADTDFSNFGKAADALNKMGDVQTALDNNQINLAVWSALTGQQIKEGDLQGFVSDIEAIGPTMSKVSNDLKGCNFDNLGKAAEALKGFGEIQAVLTDSNVKAGLANAVLDLFGSDKTVNPGDLETFGNQLIPLGEAMAKFAASVSYADLGGGKIESINTDGFDVAVKAIESLTALQDVLPNVGGLLDWITGHQQTLPEFANGLGSLGEGIRNIYDALFALKDGKAPTTEDISNLGNLISSLEMLLWRVHMYEEGFSDMDFGNLSDQLRDIIELSDPSNSEDIQRMTNFLEAISKVYSEFRTLLSVETVYDSLEAMVYDTELMKRLENAGTSISSGLAGGITSNKSLIVNAISGVLASASNVVDNGYDFSKFKDIGTSIDAAIARGVNSTESRSLLSDAVQKTIDALVAINDENSEFSPTITPVLDLSNFSSGINSMKNGLAGVSLSPNSPVMRANIGAIEIASKTDLTSVNNRIDHLTASVDSLGTKVSGMKIYLDRRMLVGGVANGVSDTIGRNGFYAARRNSP